MFDAGTVSRSHYPKQGDSFHSRINELQNSSAIQMSELKKWHSKAESESELRHQAEKKVQQLEGKVQRVLEDNQRLECQVQDWKPITGRYERCKNRLEQAKGKILVCLEEIEAEPE